METREIIDYCISSFAGTVCVESWGETGIFYNPDNLLKRGVYILTVKEKDGDNDKGSKFNRDGVYRLNIGIKKSTFIQLFGIIPLRPKAGGVVDMNYDFTEIDIILPHPVYAWMGWISVLNPSVETFEKLKPLIKEAYDLSIIKFNKRVKP